MTPYEQPLWQQWKGKKPEKLPFKTKKPAAEPGSGRGGPALTSWGGEWRKTEQRCVVEETQRWL